MQFGTEGTRSLTIIWAHRWTDLLSHRCVCFSYSLDFIFILSQNIQLFILWNDTLLHHSICQVATDNVPSIVQVAITHMTVCFALSVFFSRRECPLMHCYDVLLCRVAATDSQFARRPSPMTVCFCTSLSIFFVLSQRIRFLYCYYSSVGYVPYGFLYNMYREKRIATYRNQTYTAFINERCSGA